MFSKTCAYVQEKCINAPFGAMSQCCTEGLATTCRDTTNQIKYIMAIKYSKQEVADLRGGGHTNHYYRAMLSGNDSWDDIVRHIVRHNNGLSEGDIVKVVNAVSHCVAEKLAEGHSVSIDGIGRLKPKVRLKEGVDPSLPHNAQSLKVNIAFHPDKKLVENVSGKAKFERTADSPLRKSKYTEEERRQMALRFLDTHPYMRVSDYSGLTGLSHSAASLELKKLRQDPDSGIGSEGRRSSLLYVKK